MDKTFINVADIVEDNGKTIRENNLNEVHTVPIGSLVHVKYDDKDYLGRVVAHWRDCDGTPLYDIQPIARTLLSSGAFTVVNLNDLTSDYDSIKPEEE